MRVINQPLTIEQGQSNMKDLVTMISDWWTVKKAKNRNPDLEAKIALERTRLHDQVNLIRLTESEIRQSRVRNRFAVMDDLLNDTTRR